ncbi:MAG: hypothetical protein VB980_01905 [Opitutales bacterium]|jgi:hypothetical protein
MIKSSFTFIFVITCLALPSVTFAKSKLGEYFVAFSYYGGDAPAADMDVLDIEVSNPTSNSNDIRVGLSWMNVDKNVGGDDTSWWLDVDLLYHYDDFLNGGGMFRPYGGLGVGYFSDAAGLILAEDGFNWKFSVGSEIIFTDTFSASFGLNFYGLWNDFGENDSELELSLLNWFGDVHGVGLEYRHSNDMDVNYLGLRYLYSWQ